MRQLIKQCLPLSVALLFISCGGPKGVNTPPTQNCDAGYHKENGICVKDDNTPPVDSQPTIERLGDTTYTLTVGTDSVVGDFLLTVPSSARTFSIHILSYNAYEGSVPVLYGYVRILDGDSTTGKILSEFDMGSDHGGAKQIDLTLKPGKFRIELTATPTNKGLLQFNCNPQYIMNGDYNTHLGILGSKGFIE